MADNLGSITTKVIATADGMAAGLLDAEKQLQASMQRVAEASKAQGEAAGKGWLSGLTGSVTGLAGSAFGKVWDLAGDAYNYASKALTDQAKLYKEIGDAARHAGADVGSFQVINEALGGDTTGAIVALNKLKKALGEALIEGKDDAFKRLKLNPQDLIGMQDDQMLLTIAKRLQDVGGSVTSAYLGTQMFGKSFSNIRPILEEGGAKLEAARKNLEAFGLSFGEADYQMAKVWSKFTKQGDMLWAGLKNQVAQGLLPIVSEFVDRLPKLSDMGITFKGLSEQILNAAEVIAKAGAVVIEAWSDTETMDLAWEAVMTSIKAGWGEALEYMGGLFDGWWDEAVQYVLDHPFELAWKGLKAPLTWPMAQANWLGEKVGSGVTSLWQSVFGGASEVAEEAAGEAAAVAEEDFGDVYVAAGKAWLAHQELQDKMKGSNLFKGVEDFFSSARGRMGDIGNAAREFDPFAIWEQSLFSLEQKMESPLDKFKEQIQRIQQLSAMGRQLSEAMFLQGFDVDPFGDMLSDKTYQAIGMQIQQLMSSYKQQEYKPIAAMMEGSREAYSAINAYKSQGRESVEDALKRILEQQLETEREQVRIGREVAASSKALAEKLGVVGF